MWFEEIIPILIRKEEAKGTNTLMKLCFRLSFPFPRGKFSGLFDHGFNRV